MKGLAFSGKWLKFMAWPGLAMITAGIVAGSLSGWQPLPLGLVIFGTGLLLLGLSFSGQTAGAFWQQRSTQAGTNAVISVIALLAILGLLNFLAVKYSTRFDLTETRLYTLAPASQAITRSLPRPVRVVVFDGVQNPRDVQLLESYSRASDRFSFEYIDPFANPTAAQAFGATQPGMIFVESGEERTFLQTIGNPVNPQNPGASEALSERQLTNALEQIISDRTLTVYFVQGHGEYAIDGSQTGLAQAASSLTEKNYTVQPLNLTETQAVPDDASAIVIAGPSQDFFRAEIRAIQKFFARGGGVLLLLDPRVDAGLNRLLDDWGILLDDRLILDTSGAGQFAGLGPAAPIVSDYGDHPITQELGNGRSFFPLARPVETQELPQITSTPLLLTNAQSRAEAISDDGNLAFDPEAPPDGPYVLGVALSRPADSVSVEVIGVDGESDEGDREDEGDGDDVTESVAEASDLEEPDAESTDSEPAAAESAELGATEPETAEAEVADAESAEVDAVEPEASVEPDATEAAVADADLATTEADAIEAEAAEAEISNVDDADVAEAEPETDAADAADEAIATREEARLVMIGNSSFATDGAFDQQLNGDIFLNAISWLGQEADAALSIRPKTVTDRRILMTAQQSWSLGIFAILVLPLTGLALAVVMALRRR